jgi:hypothetical protein
MKEKEEKERKRNGKKRMKWMNPDMNKSNQCLDICSNVGLEKSILSLLGGTPTRPIGGLHVPRRGDRGPSLPRT